MSMTQEEQQVAELTKAILNRIWLGKDYDAIEEFYHEDLQVHGLIDGFALSRDEYREAIEQYLILADLEGFELHDSIMTGDRIAQRLTLNILSHATGKSAPQTSCHFGRIKDGKMYEIHVLFSTLQFFEKQGQLPQNSALMMMAGAKFS
ncbi:MAG: nuclear transport factor 2 family protein [Pelagimonas sp.]|nr:nuclear transport factor 2 family protein [Pelagimonas sp.]